MAPELPDLPPVPSTILPNEIKFLHTSTPTWPLPAWHAGSRSRSIHISVLDSSFNPPTLAHLAMASSSFPSPRPTSAAGEDDYTARLLLFSTGNVDKTLKPTDPSLTQRAQMMLLLSQRLSTSIEPVAIGLLNQPTFAGKAKVIHDHLRRTTEGESLDVRLTFLIGTDTLTRFFDPRYYTSFAGGMPEALGDFFEKGSKLVSARRGNDGESRRVERKVLERDEVQRWVGEGRVKLLGEGDEEWVGISSTAVREAVKEGDKGRLRELVMGEVAEYVEKEGLYR